MVDIFGRKVKEKVVVREEDYQRLLKQIRNLETDIERLKKENIELKKENDKLKEENAELKTLLKLDSHNSSKPPSSDPFFQKYPSKDKTGRKPGNQEGSQGHRRQFLKPTQIVERTPDVCSFCGVNIPFDISSNVYQRRQQIEMPPITPIVTEYHYHKVCCPNCGKITRQEVKEEDKSCCGPRLSSLIAMFAGLHNLPRRHIEDILETVLGIKVSLGTIDNRIHEVGEALKEPYLKLKTKLLKEEKLNIDETGWKENGKKRWLWTFVASSFTFFHIATSRGKNVLKEILGEKFLGFIISDCLSSYSSYHDHSRWQICLAHLIRKAKGLKEYEDKKISAFGELVERELRLMIKLWKNPRDEPDKMDACKTRLALACILNYESPNKYVRNLSRTILKHGESLILFTKTPGIPPTNNIAERSLRNMVISRKISFGNHSEKGIITTSRLKTIVATCKIRGINVWDYLTFALNQYRLRQPVPSLLQIAG